MERECPVCGTKTQRLLPDGSTNRYFPFCCQRCQLIDLGAWLDGRYRVPDDSEQQKNQTETGED